MTAPPSTLVLSRVRRPASDPSATVERLAEELCERWRSGERPPVEGFLARLPNSDDAEAAFELIAEEIALRHEYGLPVSENSLAARFPRWPAQVRALVLCHRALGPPAPSRFPESGEVVGDFRLLTLLGRGAVGRVFLATQRTLADRPVVLKLAPPDGHEILTLARLQHTHIVPLYSAHQFPEYGLYGLCMPHFGGTTLDRTPPVDADAVCRIGICLADALQYAHDRGLLHLDVKPSNVLLAADGTPMLLDFHLAHPPLRAGECPPAWLGGTTRFMAPEHRAAVAAVERDQPIPTDLDGRADVFGLGTTLNELLAKGEPTALSPGLKDVLARSVAADPSARYPTAAAFADDLRRHLDDLPLKGVRNRNFGERWRKWRRRRPAALPVAVALALVAVVGFGWFAHTLLQAERAARMARERQWAERGQLADELHAVCERVRPLSAAGGVPREEWERVGPRCRQVWAERERLAGPGVRSGSPAVEERIRVDLIDLAVLLAGMEVRFAPTNDPAAVRRAMAVLDEADGLFAPTPTTALQRDRLSANSHARPVPPCHSRP